MKRFFAAILLALSFATVTLAQTSNSANLFRPTATPPNPPCPYSRLFMNVSNQMALVDCAGSVTVIGSGGGGSGTVTSVGLSLPAIFSVSGSPVTASGTLTATLATQTANTVFAGPTTGSAAAPTFRALVAADIPNLDAAKITTGTMATARLGSGTANSTTFLRGDQTWAAATFSATGIKQAINVKLDHGCVGDDTTDDTTCLTNAITAAIASTGKEVYLPAGTYKTTGTITVPGGVTLQGDGKEKTIIHGTANAVILDLVRGSGDWDFIGPKVRDLAVKGSGSGAAQIGINIDDATGFRDVVLTDVRVSNAGSHGIYRGNVFSSEFRNNYSTGNSGYNFLIVQPNMPANYDYGHYSGDISSAAPAGYRIKQGNFTCWSCNGINTVGGSTGWWAVIGGKNGDIDGDTTAFYASASFRDCNIEGAKTAGILNYPGSVPSFLGLTTFVGLSASSGTYIAIDYDTDASLTPENSQRGYIEDTVIFSNSPASFYANSQPIHADGTPPVSVNGRGPKIAGAAYYNTFYNSVTSRAEKISRVDGYAPVIDVTTTTSFTNPGGRAYRVNCAAPCTLSLPSPNFYDQGNEVVTVFNISASGVNVTIAANGGAGVNGSTYVMSVQGQAVQLYPDFTSLDWRVVANTIGAGSTNYYALFDSAHTITQSGSLIQNSSSNLVFGGTTLYGTDNTIDIGSSGDNRPRHVYVGTDVISPTFYNASGGACYKSGSASPEGSVTCEPGSIYLRTNGSWYQKASGSGNTGWVVVGTGSGTITGSGTTNTVPKFSASTALADSIITESSGPATIAIAGRESITGLTINTDATNTVASLTAAATFTKNDTNTRTFDVVRIKPTFNFGGSNTGTTVNLLSVDSTNTAVTGGSFNLLSLSYGGTLKFSVDSAGAVTFANGVRQVFTPSTTVASLNFGQVASDPSSGVNGDCVYQTGSSKFRCYENGAWANMIGATPSLTSTQVPFGDGSNLLTSSSAFTYNTSTKLLSIVNGSGAASLTLNGSSDTSKVNFGAGSVPGNQGGIVFPFVGGGMSSGPGVWWCSSASYSSCSGLYINSGLTYQGTNSTHDQFKIASATSSSSNGTVVYNFAPTSGVFTQTIASSLTNTAHQGEVIDVSSTGTAAAGFGFSRLIKLENDSGTQVNASQITTTLTVVTAGSETSKVVLQTRNAGAALADALTIEASQHYGVVNAKGNQSGAFTIDFANGNYVTATATGNWTTVTFANIKAGARYVLKITQDGTGGKTWTPPTTFKYPGGVAGNILTTSANAVDVFICDAFDTSNIWCNGLFDVKNP